MSVFNAKIPFSGCFYKKKTSMGVFKHHKQPPRYEYDFFHLLQCLFYPSTTIFSGFDIEDNLRMIYLHHIYLCELFQLIPMSRINQLNDSLWSKFMTLSFSMSCRHAFCPNVINERKQAILYIWENVDIACQNMKLNEE